MDSYKIVITQRAYSDITECVLFVNNVSNKAAKSLYHEIISSIRSLTTFPKAYPVIEGMAIADQEIRRMPIHNGRYLVLYGANANTVTIIDIVDSRKNPSILKI